MKEQSRRDFLRVVGAGGIAVLVPSSLHGNEGASHSPVAEDLRARLQAARNHIRTAYLQGQSQIISTNPDRQATLEDTGWVFEGRFEIFHRPGGYRLIEKKGDLTITEISDGKRYVRRVDSTDAAKPPRVQYDGPENHEWHPRNTLGKFLPVPRDAPLYDQGMTEVRGQPCRVLGQDNLVFYVNEDIPTVTRLEVFTTAETVGARVDFHDFEEIINEVYFPRRLVITHYRQSTEAMQVQVDFEIVQINHDLPAHHFSFEGNASEGGQR